MARVVLDRGYWITARRFAPSGSSVSRRLWAAIAALGRQWPALPARGDVEVDAPPVGKRWMRRVPEIGLWIAYSKA